MIDFQFFAQKNIMNADVAGFLLQNAISVINAVQLGYSTCKVCVGQYFSKTK